MNKILTTKLAKDLIVDNWLEWDNWEWPIPEVEKIDNAIHRMVAFAPGEPAKYSVVYLEDEHVRVWE